MKVFLVMTMAVFAMSSSAFAMPKVGDDAVFALNYSKNGQTVTASVEFKLVSNNAVTDTWDEQETITANGRVQTQDQTIATSKLTTDANVQQILANCSALGGSLQTITVPAGTFNTCAAPASGDGSTGTMWISAVSFGIVQSDVTNASTGEHTVLQLVSSSALE